MDEEKKVGVVVGKKTKCVSCDQEFNEEEVCHADNGDPVCETCYNEADAIATAFKNGNEKDPEQITEYHNDTIFKIGYHKSDAWRGYYEVVSSPGYTNVHDDNILSYSEDSMDLQEFDKKVKEFCASHGIEFYVVICLSSNVFSSGYDLFVEDKRAKEVIEFIKGLKDNGMRDPVKYRTEALTGVPASQQTPQDKDAALAMMAVQAGSTPEQAVKTVQMVRAMDTLLNKVASKGETTQKNATKKPCSHTPTEYTQSGGYVRCGKL